MAEKNNATCSICGDGYHVCRSCSDFIRLQPWKIHCCSSTHFQVFQVVRGFTTGSYDKNEFKSRLKNIDLSDLESYRENIKAIIKDALKEDEPVVDELVVEDVVDNATMDKMVIEKPIYSRKRNYRMEIE